MEEEENAVNRLVNFNPLDLFFTGVCAGTYRLRPIPIASVATMILQGSLGSLNFLACDSLVPVNHKISIIYKPGLKDILFWYLY